MFTTDLNKPEQREFQITEIDGDILEQLIDSCYTGKIVLNHENVQRLLQAANEYLLTTVVAKCSEYLVTLLKPSNCIGFFLFARLYELKPLTLVSESYIAEHFTSIYHEDEFNEQPIEVIVEIFSRDDLKIQNEEEVVNAMLHWTNSDKVQRIQYFPIAIKNYKSVIIYFSLSWKILKNWLLSLVVSL